MRIRSATALAAACVLCAGLLPLHAQEYVAMTAAQEAIVTGKWVRVNNFNDRLPLQGEALAATTRCNQSMFATGGTEEPAGPQSTGEAGVEAADDAAVPAEPVQLDYSELDEMSPPDTAPLPRPKPVVEVDYSEELLALFPNPEMAEGDAVFFRSGDDLLLAEKNGPSTDLWRVDIGVTRTEIGPQFRLEFLDGWEEGEWRRALSGDGMEVIFPFQIGTNPVYDFFFSQSNVVGIGTFMKCAA